jgi:hypothetical protein
LRGECPAIAAAVGQGRQGDYISGSYRQTLAAPGDRAATIVNSEQLFDLHNNKTRSFDNYRLVSYRSAIVSNLPNSNLLTGKLLNSNLNIVELSTTLELSINRHSPLKNRYQIVTIK